MTKEIANYIVYSIEEYKRQKNLDGRTVVEIFRKNKIFDFVEKYYESLHTGSSENLILDIDQLLSNAQ